MPWGAGPRGAPKEGEKKPPKNSNKKINFFEKNCAPSKILPGFAAVNPSNFQKNFGIMKKIQRKFQKNF